MYLTALAQKLVQIQSITPYDKGCMACLEAELKPLQFQCHQIDFNDTSNLYARLNNTGPHLCFLGHTDVVPPLDEAKWQYPPFSGAIVDNVLYGRGTNDMKGAIACFISALRNFLAKYPDFSGSISVLLTSDEEGKGTDGIPRVLQWLQDRNERIDLCLIGEPTNHTRIGEIVKTGSRGSLNGTLTLQGKAGHVGYPQHALNPLPPLMHVLQKLSGMIWDQGNAFFLPTHLEVTSLDTDNPTCNLIPDCAQAKFNIRFNNTYTGQTLKTKLTRAIDQYVSLPYRLDCDVSGEAYYCDHEPWEALFRRSIESITEQSLAFSTAGATSDGRFLHTYCPAFEVGLFYAQAHQINERVALDDLTKLAQIYEALLEHYFYG